MLQDAHFARVAKEGLHCHDVDTVPASAIVRRFRRRRRRAGIAGLSWRGADGIIVHNEDRAVLENMDDLPFVTPVYKRDLTIENYFSGYLQHPYISFYTGRGCKSRCTFCLWPQTIGG